MALSVDLYFRAALSVTCFFSFLFSVSVFGCGSVCQAFFFFFFFFSVFLCVSVYHPFFSSFFSVCISVSLSVSRVFPLSVCISV